MTRIYPFFIPHAGCPNRCLYCRQDRITGIDQAPSPEQVAKTLDRILPPQGDGEVAFYGGTFTLLDESLQRAYCAAAARYIEAGRVGGVRISTRPDALCATDAERLRQWGVTTVEIGAQSFSSAVLRCVRRGYEPHQITASLDRLQEVGLAAGVQLMPGLPGGNRAEAMDSVAAAIALGPDFLRIYPTVILRGSALEEMWQAGEYTPLGLAEAVDWCAEILWNCRLAGVPVIRMGLQSSPELEGAVAAGPYHPAFGQLVRSRLWLRVLLRGGELTGRVKAGVHAADLAEAIGHRRQNITALSERFGTFSLYAAEIDRGHAIFGESTFSAAELAAYQE
jgi:histone acetyltransferase (RNA polymerase elongator complex component)